MESLRDLSHEIDYACWLFGRPIDVQAILTNGGALGIESEEAADLLWEVPGGPTVSIRVDYTTRTPKRRMHVTGDRGIAEWDAIAGAVRLWRDNAETVIHSELPDPGDKYRRQADGFLDVCAGVRCDDLATIEEGVFIAAVCDAARQSAMSRRSESVADFLRKP